MPAHQSGSPFQSTTTSDPRHWPAGHHRSTTAVPSWMWAGGVRTWFVPHHRPRTESTTARNAHASLHGLPERIGAINLGTSRLASTPLPSAAGCCWPPDDPHRSGILSAFEAAGRSHICPGQTLTPRWNGTVIARTKAPDAGSSLMGWITPAGGRCPNVATPATTIPPRIWAGSLGAAGPPIRGIPAGRQYQRTIRQRSATSIPPRKGRFRTPVAHPRETISLPGTLGVAHPRGTRTPCSMACI